MPAPAQPSSPRRVALPGLSWNATLRRQPSPPGRRAPWEAPMEYRKLGRSGLKVSPLCLGTMMFGGPTDEPTAGRIVARAREAGVNFIDTADVYTDGRSEE